MRPPPSSSRQPPSLPVAVSPDSAPSRKDRLTVVEHVYHQSSHGPGAACHSAGWEKRLTSDEQPYARTYTLTEGDWTPLGTGWIDPDRVGLLVLCNGKDLPHGEAMKSGVLEFSLQKEGPAEWRLEVRETMRGTPLSLQHARLRVVGGPVRCTVILYPA